MCQKNYTIESEKKKVFKYKHLNYTERTQIERWKNIENKSCKEIANLLNKSIRTIQREINRGLVIVKDQLWRDKKIYDADTAQRKYDYYIHSKGAEIKLGTDYELAKYIEDGIKIEKKSPEIVEKIEVIWLGGHSLLQDNNLEFNFRQDVNAVRIVFNSKVKLIIVPCKNVASNLRTTIYELNYYLKDKSELCNYLIDRFYNDGYHGIQERRVIWDISVIAYMINKNWFTSKEISCPNINNDTSYELTNDRHTITMVNYIDVNKVYLDLFKKLGE